MTLAQASEKAWGAAAQIVKAIAAGAGMELIIVTGISTTASLTLLERETTGGQSIVEIYSAMPATICT